MVYPGTRGTRASQCVEGLDYDQDLLIPQHLTLDHKLCAIQANICDVLPLIRVQPAQAHDSEMMDAHPTHNPLHKQASRLLHYARARLSTNGSRCTGPGVDLHVFPGFRLVFSFSTVAAQRPVSVSLTQCLPRQNPKP